MTATFSDFAQDLELQPYWWEDAPVRPLPPVEPPARIDVAVVGAGYGGLSAALTLARGGRGVVVFDAGDPGEGASTRNGGAVGETLRVSFPALTERHGLETAIALYREVRDGRAWLDQFIAGEAIDCHYARVGRFVGCHKPQDYDRLARDLELRQKHVGFDAVMVPKAEVHTMIDTDRYHGGRLIRSDGNLQPAMFHRGLLERAMAAGANVIGQTRVTAIAREDKHFVLTAGGRRVVAGDVVIATNGYTGPELPWLRRRLIPIQSQIIATEPLPPATIARLFPGNRQQGDTCNLHYYFRTSPDGTRILFGGRAGGHEINDPLRRGTHLFRRMVELFPELKETRVTHSWAGFIAYTFDHLQHMSFHDGIHYVSGCCGSGVVMATYLGHKTGLRVLGRPEAETAFDRPYRTRPFYTGTPWFMPAVMCYFGLRDRWRI
ncbi:MAG: FAD-binding oxidoreductase [Rhodospirillales bacterium]|nr:FAD-binding oxidoreductase [Rhodospirillales bacterium]MSP80319.1 FAD-binding oxidoreductase [Rhodospirillales bacterium]